MRRPHRPHHQRALTWGGPAAPSALRHRGTRRSVSDCLSRHSLRPHFAIWVWSERRIGLRSAARGAFLSHGSERCDILAPRAAVLTMKNKVAARKVPGHSFVPSNLSRQPAARPAKMSERGGMSDKNRSRATAGGAHYCQQGSPMAARRCLCFASKSPMRNRIGLPSMRATESAIFLVSLTELSCSRPTVIIR